MTIAGQLRSQIEAKKRELRRITDGCRSGGETRDMTPDEAAKFDALMATVEDLQTRIGRLEDIEATEAADGEEAPARSNPPTRRRSSPVGEAPAVHTEKRPYSILRAIRLASEGRPIDGLEGEASQEMARRTGRPPKGFFLPLGSDPEVRKLMNGGRELERRADLTTTTGTGGIFTMAELPMIELLRNKLVVRELGATVLTGLQGNLAIPRQTGSATFYWLAEGSSATASAPTLDQVPLTPHVAIALTNISRKFIYQSSVDAEMFVRNDLANTAAREWDRVAINGTGTTQPLGILQNTAIQTLSAGLQGGTNGAAVTYAQVVGMESQVATYNADMGKLKYLTSPSQRGKLKAAPIIGSTYPVFIYGDGNGLVSGYGSRGAVGLINGYEARASNVVPSNLTKGTATAICSAIIFANWEDLIIGSWDDAADVILNPYTLQASGAVTISLEMGLDCIQRHAESFAIITDAL